DAADLAAARDIFDGFAYYVGGQMGVQLGDRAEFAGVRVVHPDFFRVFDAVPIAGRRFEATDARSAAIVSLAFARRQFGDAPAAVGRTVFFEDRAYTVVGVMPPAMDFPAGTDVWIAASLLPENRSRTGHAYRAVARLAPRVSADAANDRLATLARR